MKLKPKHCPLLRHDGVKKARLRSMRNYLNTLVILADINNPIVKRKLEDSSGTEPGARDGRLDSPPQISRRFSAVLRPHQQSQM
jgi:hypothetical protein